VDEALTRFRQAVQLNPDNPRIRSDLGTALARKGRYEEAIEHYRVAVRIDPTFAKAHLNLGQLLVKEGDRDAGLRHLSEAVRFDPKAVQGHLLIAQIHLDRHDMPRCIAALRKAHELAPQNHDLTRKLAWLLATTPGLTRNDRSEAVRLARDAIASGPGRSPVLMDALAAALAATARFDEAIRTVRQAIELAERDGNTDAAREYRERLRLYEAGQPYIRRTP
jgi:tetratricopeptide (TPR) repeat protein